MAASDAAVPAGFSARLPRPRFRRRARCDTVLQLEAAECGPAALAMVLSHFGRRVPLEELRDLCGVSRDGSKASSLLKAARSYGLVARGLRAEPEQLRDLRPPMIAFVNFNHFLVVEGLRGKTVYLNDPASGPRRVSLAEFDAMFTGVVLTFERGDAFRRADTRPSQVASLRQRLRGAEAALLFAVLASLALVIPGIALPVFSRVFVDQVLVAGLDDWLAPLLFGIAATALVRWVLTELQTQVLLRAETRLAVDGSKAALWRMLRLPVRFFSQRFAGEIADRLDLNDGLAQLLTGELARAALSLVTALFFFLVMLSYDVTLALIGGALTAANVVVLAIVSRRLGDGWRRLTIERGQLAATAVAGLNDIETFKAAGAEDAFFSRWAGLQARVVNSEQSLGLPLLLLGAVPGFLQALATAAILVVGGLQIMAGEMTIGMLVAFQTLMLSLAAPAAALTRFGAQIQQLRGFTARLDDILHQPLDRRFEQRSGVKLERLPRGRVVLSGVTFGHAPLEPPLIAGLDVTIRPGQRIALVGPSGSGKSTIGRIVAGLYRPWAGEVLIDDRGLDDWPAAALSARLAYVDQEIALFEGTVRDNLSLWDPTIPEQDIIAAARDAQIHESIAARPGGYGARIEEGGRNFSGGQRQRLDLARALARNPSILVLDEATSALDPVTELQVIDAIRRRGVTCLIIAHRLSAIRDCDEIILLEGGKPIERGRHEELLARSGRYHALIET